MSATIRQSHANNDLPLWLSASAPPPTPTPAFQNVFNITDYSLPLTIAEAGTGWTTLVAQSITPNINGVVTVLASARVLTGGTNATPQMSLAVSFNVNGFLITEPVPNVITSTNGGDSLVITSQWQFPSSGGTTNVVEFVGTSQYIAPGQPGFLCESARITLLSN